MPVFGYPLVPYAEESSDLWSYLYRHALESKANPMPTDRTFESQPYTDKRQSLLVSILNKHQRVQSFQDSVLGSFTKGSKINRKALRTSATPSRVQSKFLQSPEPERVFRSVMSNEAAPKQEEQTTMGMTSKLINQIKMKDDKTAETLSEMMASQYKILRLSPDGNQELDFVKWASDLDQQHPIAKSYQQLRKGHFDKLRKERALQLSKDLKLQSSGGTKSGISKINFTSPQIKPLYETPAIAKSEVKSRNTTTLSHNFSLRLESTQDASNQEATKSKRQYALTRSAHSHTPYLNKSRNQYRSNNLITQKFDLSKQKLASQVRKHLNIVQKTNTYENQFLNGKESANFETANPINVYYQIAQNSDYCFKTLDILKPIQRQDIQSLREDYKSRNLQDMKAARFEKTDYHPSPLIMSSYSGLKKSRILESKQRSLSSNFSQDLTHNNEKTQAHIEPEMPLTGYNYQRYLNEGTVLFKAAKSATRVKDLMTHMDKDLMRKRQELNKQKYEVLLARK